MKLTSSISINNYIRWYHDISLQDICHVGGKNASLGEMTRELSFNGIVVPKGFAIIGWAYDQYIKYNGLRSIINEYINKLDYNNINDIKNASKNIKKCIINGKFPREIKSSIIEAYHILSQEYNTNEVDVAVRSSATAEDLPNASFAGQQDTFLNIKGEERLLHSIKLCYASIYSDRVLLYRKEMGYDTLKISMSVGIQKMVRSDLAYSGIMFTIEPESGFKNIIVINASYGLGENIVRGNVNPDEYYIFKELIHSRYNPVIKKVLGRKEKKLIYSNTNNNEINLIDIDVPIIDRNKYVLSKEEVITLSKWGIIIEKHYSKKYGKYTPMDIEWAKDGNDNNIYVLQARPITTKINNENNIITIYKIEEKGKVIIEGTRIGEKIINGTIKNIKSINEAHRFNIGDILVTENTDPDWESIMSKASAIITDKGAKTCHAAIICRELDIPAVIGTYNATKILKDDQKVTVVCIEGEKGQVYDGIINYKKDIIKINKKIITQTRVMMNIGNPQKAIQLSSLPNDGVGLARQEFILSNYVKIHPLALIHYNKLSSNDTKNIIDKITENYTNKEEYYIDKLAEGIALIAAAFYPKDVILRLSDFKSNEYINLIGGAEFEPQERNPMIGFRGASRYYNNRYNQAFKLECCAIKKARDEIGLKNIKIMVPFVRTIMEGICVIEELNKNGINQGKNGTEIYMMCEIPSNIILAEEFLNIYDGYSIGTNDLTQLILGVDRDSEIISYIYDERNDAVKKSISNVINVAKKKNKKVGICGEAPSLYEEFLKFLIIEGIDSISVNPSSIQSIKIKVSELEKNIKYEKEEV
ncbi:phosphoenolpyruvate synthase [Candidatus Methylacidiphilum infernorum]|uniref:Phosphoenolpyruvate synthase n=1 Tax=Methylacidiphilum infernorum (isolate V4) TaxID=481448 RepID=B3DWD9_METI4|nr:phosphoenolpyruvate synthase [Candidatus Methylacidiphilum infernorum]ACD83642.1 Phosphoenolpyruvate synthase/pyruvate phosphate dikinase [Methylacidiphilum infernorum V4]